MAMMVFNALSNRILIVTIASKPFNLMIILVFAHTSAISDLVFAHISSISDEKFYDDLDVA